MIIFDLCCRFYVLDTMNRTIYEIIETRKKPTQMNQHFKNVTCLVRGSIDLFFSYLYDFTYITTYVLSTLLRIFKIEEKHDQFQLVALTKTLWKQQC